MEAMTTRSQVEVCWRKPSRAVPIIAGIATVGVALALTESVWAEGFKCTSGDAQCLIIAIDQSNANGHPENTIHLDAGTYTLTNIDNDNDGPNGLPSITSTLTIDVLGNKTATITRARDALAFRLLHVGKSGRLTLQGVTLSYGSLVSTLSEFGGALFNNGGVVTIANSAFVSNIAFSGGGGVINKDGDMTIFNTAFVDNRADGGGGISNSGQLTIYGSTFDNNVAMAGGGGGLVTRNGVVRIAQSRFTKNHAGQIAGGLEVLGGSVSISETTFDGNFADGASAIAVLNAATNVSVSDSAFVDNLGAGAGEGSVIANSGTVQVQNSTFFRSVPDLVGIGLAGIMIANGGTVTLINSTLAYNMTVVVGGGSLIFSGTNATTNLQNVIVTNNAPESFRDCQGAVTSLGNNLIHDPTGCTIILQPTDLTGDAGLGTFTDDGTPGNGHLPLLATSPAIDAANDSVCPQKDQIGQPRKPRCDIGAIEFRPGARSQP